jgi:hypothetical protein
MIAGSLAAPAQEVSILPYPNPSSEEIKRYLVLTDAQLTSLNTIAAARRQAQSNVYNQISEKSTALHNLLSAGSTDAARIGQLMIEINNLQKQVVPTEPYRSQALNILTNEQKAKLPPLAQALQLQGTAYQASSLNLIDGPNIGRVYPADLGAVSPGILPGVSPPSTSN